MMGVFFHEINSVGDLYNQGVSWQKAVLRTYWMLVLQRKLFIIKMDPVTLLLLYVSFRVKQFAGDFLLQTDWMALNKGKPGREGYRALFSHTIYHAAGTALIALLFAPALWWLGLADFCVHSLIDRTKGVLTYRKGWQYTDRWFWWSFGLDQEAHNYTHLAYIVLIVAHAGGLFL